MFEIIETIYLWEKMSWGSFRKVNYKMFLRIIYFIYMYKEDLESYNL